MKPTRRPVVAKVVLTVCLVLFCPTRHHHASATAMSSSSTNQQHHNPTAASPQHGESPQPAAQPASSSGGGRHRRTVPVEYQLPDTNGVFFGKRFVSLLHQQQRRASAVADRPDDGSAVLISGGLPSATQELPDTTGLFFGKRRVGLNGDRRSSADGRQRGPAGVIVGRPISDEKLTFASTSDLAGDAVADDDQFFVGDGSWIMTNNGAGLQTELGDVIGVVDSERNAADRMLAVTSVMGDACRGGEQLYVVRCGGGSSRRKNDQRQRLLCQAVMAQSQQPCQAAADGVRMR